MSDLEDVLLAGYVFVLGAVVGSFANVCIHRLPRGESIVFPPSRCPSCRERIAPRDNVPILAWLWLRGRCRSCGARISARYPLVEAGMGALFLLGYLRWGVSGSALAFALLAAASLVLVMTDLESRVLPDAVTLGTLALALLLAGARDLLGPRPFRPGDSYLAAALLGAALGAGILLLARVGYQAVRGVEGMGMGDVTMIAMIGALTGAGGILVTLFLASSLGALIGGAAIGVQRLRWSLERARWKEREPEELGPSTLLVADRTGRLLRPCPVFAEMPGAAAAGEPLSRSSGVARRVAAFVRLALRRARAGLATEVARVHLDDGADYFRVVSLRGVPLRDRLLVLAARTDIPFGVFLALGGVVTLLVGRPILEALFQGWAPGGKLLP